MWKWLKILTLALLPASAWAQDSAQTAEDKGFLTSFLETNLSGLGRTVTIDGFAGALSSRATFTRLTIADAQGVWITIDDGAISWSRSALLSGRVEIDELSAASIDLLRAPSLATSPKTVEASSGFALPELPVSVRIGLLRAEKLTLHEPVLGQEVVVSINGTGQLAGGEGSTEFTITRADGKVGDLTLKASYANATRQATIDLLAKEDADGIAATLLDLPGKPPVQLAMHGSGPIDDFSTDIALATDGQPRLTGNVKLGSKTVASGKQTERRFALKLAGDISPLLQPAYRDFFGTSVSLEAEGVDIPGVRTDLTRLVLDSAGVDLTGRLNLSPERVPLGAALTVRLGLADQQDLLLPIAGEPTFVRNGTLLVRYDETKGEGWTLSGDLNGFRRKEVTIGSLQLDGSGRVLRSTGGSARILGSLAFTANDLTMADPALAQALGPNVRGRTVLSWQDGKPLTLRSLEAQAGDLGLTGDLAFAVQGLDLLTTGNLTLKTPDVSRFSKFAQRPLSGAAEISLSGSGALVTGAFDVTASAHGTALSVDQPMADRLLSGPSQIDLSARRDQTGILIRQLDVRVPALTAALSGHLSSDAQDLTGKLDFSDIGALGPGFSGRFAADAVLSGPIGKRSLTLTGDGSNLAVGNALADTVIGGRSAVTVSLKEADGVFDLERAQLTTAELSLSAETKGPPGTFAIDAKLRDAARLAPGFSGPLTAQGTVSRNATGYAVQIAATGPGQTNAKASGTVASDFSTVDLALSGMGQSAVVNSLIQPRSVDGPVRFDLKISGPPALSSISGQVVGTGIRIASPSERLSIENANVTADISGGQANLRAAADIRGGRRVELSGPVSLDAPHDANLTVNLSHARLRDPSLYEALISGTITVSGPLLGGATIGGAITLDETEIVVAPVSFAGSEIFPITHVNEPAASRVTRRRAGLDKSTAARTPSVFGLDLQVSAPARLFVRGRGLDAEMSGSVHLRGTTADVQPSGSFTLIRGRLNLLGKRFVLDEGLVQLLGSLVPYLSFTASADTFGTTSTIVLDGPASAPKIHFTSSSGLPEEEVLSQLLFGNGIDNISAFQLAQLANAIATLTGKGSDSIIVKLRKSARLDDLDIIADDEGNAAIKAGKYVTDKVYTEATIGADGKSKIDLNLDINSDLSLRGTVGTDGQTGAGIFFKRDY
jgi:translocation and assembly module TamB